MAGSIDSPEQARLLAALGDTESSDVRLEQSEDREEDAKDGRQAIHAPLESGDAKSKLGGRGVQTGCRCDDLGCALHPAGHVERGIPMPVAIVVSPVSRTSRTSRWS